MEETMPLPTPGNGRRHVGGGRDPDVPPGTDCLLFLPGHQVHWIQVRQSDRDGAHRPEPGRLVSAAPDGLVVVEVAGERRRLWHHRPDHLAAVVAANGGVVRHQPRWRLLRIPSPSGDGEACFCVADHHDPERVPCSSEEPVDDLVERLRTAGGFTVTVPPQGSVDRRGP
jgi:hypothetical protein